ncbi:MAG: hypothetical protein AAF721_40710, partial [Myxococcota bacterium]
MASPAPQWPDLSRPAQSTKDGRLDAAVIVVRDRDGGQAVAKAWARYLVQGRGVPRARVRVLSGPRAQARRVHAALQSARRS